MIKYAYLSTAKTYRPFDGTSGTYVSVAPDTESVAKMKRWAATLGIPLSETRENELHCTVVWSTAVANDVTCDPTKFYETTFDHFEYWDGHDGDGYITAVLAPGELRALHKKWVDRGAVHSFDDYLPHVTLLSKIRSTETLYQKMLSLSQKFKGEYVRFTNEQVENVKS